MATIIVFFKKNLSLVAVYILIFALIVASKLVSAGVKTGIETCLTLVIPSLFIFMILSNIIIGSGLDKAIATPFKLIGKLLFGLDCSLFSIVLLSLVGGYPIGAKLIATKVKRGELSVKNANYMLCYCVNCGPAFLISGVGVAIFNNFTVGVILYLSQVIACFTVGFLLRNKGVSSTNKTMQKNSGASLVVDAVSDAVRSMAIVCGLIILFSALMPLLSTFLGKFQTLANGILEVTTACKAVSSLPNAIVLIAIFTAFGGACVHMQIAAMLNKTGVSLKYFYLYRLPYTAISGVIMWIYLVLNPQPLNCFGLSNAQAQINTVSPTATIFLILLSIMLLFFSKKFDKIKE